MGDLFLMPCFAHILVLTEHMKELTVSIITENLWFRNFVMENKHAPF